MKRGWLVGVLLALVQANAGAVVDFSQAPFREAPAAFVHQLKAALPAIGPYLARESILLDLRALHADNANHRLVAGSLYEQLEDPEAFAADLERVGQRADRDLAKSLARRLIAAQKKADKSAGPWICEKIDSLLEAARGGELDLQAESEALHDLARFIALGGRTQDALRRFSIHYAEQMQRRFIAALEAEGVTATEFAEAPGALPIEELYSGPGGPPAGAPAATSYDGAMLKVDASGLLLPKPDQALLAKISGKRRIDANDLAEILYKTVQDPRYRVMDLGSQVMIADPSSKSKIFAAEVRPGEDTIHFWFTRPGWPVDHANMVIRMVLSKFGVRVDFTRADFSYVAHRDRIDPGQIERLTVN